MRFILLCKVGSISWVLAIRTCWLDPQKFAPCVSIAITLAYLREASDFMTRSASQFRILLTARSILFWLSSDS